MKYLYLSVLVMTSIYIPASNAGTENHQNDEKKIPTKQLPRWYTPQQVSNGKQIYNTHCIECHQPDARGNAKWNYKNDEGYYPAPPLNGTAHTWHHSISSLKRTIRVGGKPVGGTMPGFNATLSDQQIDDVISYFQSLWRDEIYSAWVRRNHTTAR